MSFTVPLPPAAHSFIIGPAVINTHVTFTGKLTSSESCHPSHFHGHGCQCTLTGTSLTRSHWHGREHVEAQCAAAPARVPVSQAGRGARGGHCARRCLQPASPRAAPPPRLTPTTLSICDSAVHRKRCNDNWFLFANCASSWSPTTGVLPPRAQLCIRYCSNKQQPGEQ